MADDDYEPESVVVDLIKELVDCVVSESEEEELKKGPLPQVVFRNAALK